MRELYSEIIILLEHINFDLLWKGFHIFQFALYNETTVYFDTFEVPYDNRFLGNTSIKYEDKQIAIWQVTDPKQEDPEILMSKLVHEMFHAFQFEVKESRFPQDLRILDYPIDTRNFGLKYAENNILADAYMESDTSQKRILLSQFISIRKQRKEIIGDMIQCEYLSETAEGIADYVGTMALKQISVEKYKNSMNQYIDYLRNPGEMLFNVRKISYYSGAVFLITVVGADISVYHDIGNCKESVFELISTSFDVINTVRIVYDKDIEEQVKCYLAHKEMCFDEFFKSRREQTKANSTICGYDPMNMIKLNNKILCSRFIILKDNITNKQTFLQGPIMLEMKQGSINQVFSYYK